MRDLQAKGAPPSLRHAHPPISSTVRTSVSGWNATHANQKSFPCTTGARLAPSSGPTTARPSTSHLEPVSRSTISPSRASKVRDMPFTVGEKTAVDPTVLKERASRLAGVANEPISPNADGSTCSGKGERVPPTKNMAMARPSTVSFITGYSRRSEKGYATLLPSTITDTTRSLGWIPPSPNTPLAVSWEASTSYPPYGGLSYTKLEARVASEEQSFEKRVSRSRPG